MVTRGSYRGLLKLFEMSSREYKRLLNFLAAHDCRVDYREFRTGSPDTGRRSRSILLPNRLQPRADDASSGAQPQEGPRV
jgi:hypothetical protein